MVKTAYIGRFEKNGDESEKKKKQIYNFGAIAHEVKISNKLNYQKRKKSSLPVLFNLLIDMSTIMIREKKF